MSCRKDRPPVFPRRFRLGDRPSREGRNDGIPCFLAAFGRIKAVIDPVFRESCYIRQREIQRRVVFRFARKIPERDVVRRPLPMIRRVNRAKGRDSGRRAAVQQLLFCRARVRPQIRLASTAERFTAIIEARKPSCVPPMRSPQLTDTAPLRVSAGGIATIVAAVFFRAVVNGFDIHFIFGVAIFAKKLGRRRYSACRSSGIFSSPRFQFHRRASFSHFSIPACNTLLLWDT